MTETLMTFLAARLDEDEAAAKAARETVCWPWQDDEFSDQPQEWIAHHARHDPARVLREVEAGRKILALHQEDKDWPVVCMICLSDRADTAELWTPDGWPCQTLRLLAAVYSDHPDYPEDGLWPR